MKQTMIEKVARAISRLYYNHEDAWEMHINPAKAAIEAMREPTVKMICAVLDENDKRRTTISEEWNIMIDVALEEHQQ